MSEKLNGSFSGLWTCDLCGKTGTDCTCEHFARNGTVGHDKTLTDAELAAELWYQISVFQGWDGMASIFTENEAGLEVQRQRMFDMQYLAEEPDYRD